MGTRVATAGVVPSAAGPGGTEAARRRAGWLNGLVGMAIFSASLPATRVAVLQFDPLFLTFLRAVIAGMLGLAALLLLRQPRPARGDLPALLIVAGGVAVGFPLLTALALRHVTSAHAVVYLGLLPLATAGFGVVRAGERPRPAFWLFALLGAAIVVGYALAQAVRGGAASEEGLGDGLMLAAVALCGLGYAEGARLSRTLGGWQVISWALVLSLPLMTPLALLLAPRSWATWAGIGWPALAALAYVSVFSMLVGFVFWYRGLALGGIAAVGQLQLLQPFLGFGLAALLLGERVEPGMLVSCAAILACVALARRYAA